MVTTTPLEWLNEFQVNIIDTDGTRDDQFDSQVVQLSDGNVLVAWASNSDPASGAGSSENTDIIGRIFDPLGVPVTGEIQLNSVVGGFATSAGFHSIDAMPGGGFVVSYRSFFASLNNPDLSLEVDVYNNAGTFQRNIQVDDVSNLVNGRFEEPVIAVASDTRAMIVYGDEGDVKADVINPTTGAIVTANILIANQTFNDFHGADVHALSSNLYVVVFADKDPGNDEVYYHLMDGSGGNVTVSPQLIDASFADANDPKVTELSNGDFVVTWEIDGSGGTNSGIRFAVIDSLFGIQGGVQNPLTTVAGNQTHQNVVALEEGGFVITWFDENTADLRAQRHDNAGAKIGNEFVIENLSTSEITNIDVATLEDGRFQVAWTRLASGDADVFTSIWDPRDEPNMTPVYTNNMLIGTPESNTIIPLPAGFDEFHMAGGNDIIWLQNLTDAAGKVFNGGTGNDTLGQAGPGSLFFLGTTIEEFETYKFNAGGSAGQKTTWFYDDQVTSFTTIDFAQGGATKADRLYVQLDADASIDLSGLTILDFDTKYDEIIIRGDSTAETITGTNVNDTIRGAGGLDNMDGGDGFDTLDMNGGGYGGAVTVDLEVGGIVSSQGVEVAESFENFLGSSADETVIGTDAHANEIRGGAGDDVIDGGLLADHTFGDGGNDTFILDVAAGDISSGNETIDGGANTDTIRVVGGSGTRVDNLRNQNISSIEEISFGHGQFAQAVDRTIEFSAIQFNQGDISLTGNIDVTASNGTQKLKIYMTSEDTLDLSDLTFTNFGTGDFVEVIGDSTGEKITGSLKNDIIEGNSGEDQLDGHLGSDILDGGAQNDTFTIRGLGDTVLGGTGDDTIHVDDFNTSVAHQIDGGDDTDTIDFSGFQSQYAIDLGGGTWIRKSDSEDVTSSLMNIENVTAGSGDDDVKGSSGVNVLRGNAGIDVIDGGAANDFLYGGNHNDDLIGGTGADMMYGNIGNDEYWADDAGDMTIEAANEGYDRVFVDGVATWFLADNMERLTFTDTGNHVAFGNELNNRMDGNAGNERFVIDEAGNDIYSGGQGEDSFDGRSSDVKLTVRLDNQALNADAVAGDTFSSMEKFFGSLTEDDYMKTGAARAKFSGYGGEDVLIGGNSIDTLQGGADDDLLFGGAAIDSLWGGTGNDTLNGGNANDIFLYVETDFGEDTITDFQDGGDRLKIHSAVATDINDFTIAGNGSNQVTLTYDADPTNFITLNGSLGNNITLDATDFLFY